MSCEFSVGQTVAGNERDAISTIPAWLWADAMHPDGARLAEINHVLPVCVLVGRLTRGGVG